MLNQGYLLNSLLRQNMTTKQAAFLHPTFPTLAIFFSGDKYAIIDAQFPDRSKNVVFGPRLIGTDWPALVEAGFETGVDAVVSNPRDNTTAYFFSGGKFALVKVAPPGGTSTLVEGPKDLSQWKSLNEAGFKSVDAILTIPKDGQSGWAYVFSGENYVYLQIDPVNGSHERVLNIAREWPSLKTLGFAKDLGLAFPIPGTSKEAYFFKGSQYSGVGNIIHGIFIYPTVLSSPY